MKKSAFTLADVLITLAIIGVVAAITIPTMISGFRNKVLKVHFDKCEARAKEIEHAVANEMGVNNFKDLNNLAYNNTDFENLVDAAWHNAIMENYHVDTGFISDNRHYLRDKVSLYNYRGVRMPSGFNIYGFTSYARASVKHKDYYQFKDGCTISALTFFYHSKADGIYYSFDTNGFYKGPNRWGYDVFTTPGNWYPICSKVATGRSNGNTYEGRGCYTYAKKDVNPDDNTKSYWKSL